MRQSMNKAGTKDFLLLIRGAEPYAVKLNPFG